MAYTPPGWLPEWASIYPDGRVSYYELFSKGGGRRRQKRCGTTAEAEKYVRSLMRQAERSAGLNVAAGSTWADLCQAWVDAHDDGTTPEGTLRRRMSSINAWILPNVGTVPVIDSNLATLLTVADAAAKAGVSRSTFDGVVQAMQVIAEWGRARGWMPADPLGADSDRRAQLKTLRRKLRDPGKHAANDGDGDAGLTIAQVPTWEDVEALADAVADRVGGIARSKTVGEHYGRAVRIAAGTGLRLTELLGLTVDAVDLDSGLVAVRVQLDRYKLWKPDGPMPTAPPKHGRRRQAVAWAKVRADLVAAVEVAEDGPVFPPYRDQTWWADAWGRLLEAAREDAGWTWPGHYLRHHYGSYSLATRAAGGFGMDPVQVQHSMGHKDLSTTLNTYVQATRPASGWVE